MRCRVFLLLGLCACAATARAQGLEIRATGRLPAASADQAEAARAIALVDAHRQLWRTAVTRLAARPELKPLQLKPSRLEAYTAAFVEPQEVPAPAGAAAAAATPVTVRATLDPRALARRMAAVHRDQDAAFFLEVAWAELQKLTDPAAFAVRLLTLQATAAMARTESVTVGGRAPSDAGRTRARQLVEIATARLPGSPDVRFAQGDLLLDAQQLEAAEGAYRAGLAARPDSLEGREKLAEALRLQVKLGEAEAELRDMLRREPGSARAHTHLALVLRGQRRNPEALAEHEEAIRLDPDLVDAHNDRAILLAGQGRMADAVTGFREVIRIDPESAMAYFNLATALAELDRDIEAAAALREVIRINPNHYNARFNLGELLRLEGKFDDAATQFAEFVRLAPGDTPTSRRNIERARDYIAKFREP